MTFKHTFAGMTLAAVSLLVAIPAFAGNTPGSVTMKSNTAAPAPEPADCAKDRAAIKNLLNNEMPWSWFSYQSLQIEKAQSAVSALQRAPASQPGRDQNLASAKSQLNKLQAEYDTAKQKNDKIDQTVKALQIHMGHLGCRQ